MTARAVTVMLTQTAINEAIGQLIRTRLAEAGGVDVGGAKSGGYFLATVDLPNVPGAEVTAIADRGGDGTKITYLIDDAVPAAARQR